MRQNVRRSVGQSDAAFAENIPHQSIDKFCFKRSDVVFGIVHRYIQRGLFGDAALECDLSQYGQQDILYSRSRGLFRMCFDTGKQGFLPPEYMKKQIADGTAVFGVCQLLIQIVIQTHPAGIDSFQSRYGIGQDIDSGSLLRSMAVIFHWRQSMCCCGSLSESDR